MSGELPDLEQLSVEALLRRVVALPYRAQLRLFDVLAERLADAGRPTGKQDDRIGRQRVALAAMQQVADALRLAPGTAPTTSEFNDECKRLGLATNVSAVGRAFNGWRNATIAFEGNHIPESARQVRQRQALRGGRIDGGGPADILAVVAQWLDSDECQDHTPDDYAQWRFRYNERAAAAGTPTAVSWAHLSNKVFPEMTVEDIIAAARGEVEDWSKLCRQRAEQRLQWEENPLKLVSTVTAAALFGTTYAVLEDGVRNRRPGFPVIVARLSAEKLMYADDVMLCAARKSPPARKTEELGPALLNSRGVAEVLDEKYRRVTNALKRKAWHIIPEPKGRTRLQAYWLRAEVEAWSPPRTASR